MGVLFFVRIFFSNYNKSRLPGRYISSFFIEKVDQDYTTFTESISKERQIPTRSICLRNAIHPFYAAINL